MRRALSLLAMSLGFLGVCAYGIGVAANDSSWAVAAWLGLIFLGIPAFLLAIRDCVFALLSNKSESFKAWLMLHVCAAFAAFVGFLLAWGARASNHPKADIHQWLPLILVALVYVAPFLLAIHSGSLRFLKVLAKPFLRNRPGGGE